MSKRIAVFIGQLIQSYQNDIIEAIVDIAPGLGYEVEIFSDFGTCGENYLHSDGEKNIINLPYLEDYAGIILAPDTYDVKGMYDELADKVKKEARCPVVNLRYEDSRFYNILIDDSSAMSDMVEHFITIHGFKRICFMTGKLDMQDARRRLQGYRNTMSKYNLPVTEHMVFEGDYWRYKGEEALNWFFDGEEQPEAIVCSNDYMAISICEELQKRGYRVPEDISVSGFDNIDEAKYSDPPIASVDVPAEAMGRVAVQTIDKIAKGWPSEQNIYVPVTGNYQGTCGCGMKLREKRIAELFTKNQYLGGIVQQVTYMNVEFEGCDTLEELLHTAFVYSYNFAYDMIYLCFCDNYEKAEEEALSFEQYTEHMVLRAVLSRNLGFSMCDEVFDRRDILPEKYKKMDDVVYLLPLHYKNHCLGYLAMQTEKVNNLKEIFPAWVLMMASFIDKVTLYAENRNLMEFREQSLRDELTGLYNRRMFEKALKSRSQRAMSKRVNFCFVSMDMDGLKYINDTFGHMEGDFALRAIADILKEFESDSVICARVGGDEFNMCVDTTSDKEMQALLNKVNTRIEEFNGKSQKPYQLSASIGYAFYQRGKELSDCMEKADKNMYAEKAKKKKEGFTR